MPQPTSEVEVHPTTAEHALALSALQKTVFPDLAPAERFSAENYLNHIETFPEGQFVALHKGEVVGMTSSLRATRNVLEEDHRFCDMVPGGNLTSHDPLGEWLYGLDIGVHPSFRNQGVAKALYRARHHTVESLGLKGQVTVGMLNGYGRFRNELTVEQYFRQVQTGEVVDPTVTAQSRVGFQVVRLVRNYVEDPTCGHAGALLRMDNRKQLP